MKSLATGARYRSLSLLVALGLTLGSAACSSGAGEHPDVEPGDPAIASETTHPASGSEQMPIECDAWLWEEGGTVSSAQLGGCIASAYALAGSGRNTITSSPDGSGDGYALWETTREGYRAHVFLLNGDELYVNDTDCLWKREGSWIDGGDGSSHPLAPAANGVCKTWRFLAAPQSIAAVWADAPAWTLIGTEDAETDPGTLVNAWRLEVSAAYPSMIGTEVSRHVIWLNSSGLIVRQETTSSLAGFTVDTVNQYTEYGEQFDLEPPIQ